MSRKIIKKVRKPGKPYVLSEKELLDDLRRVASLLTDKDLTIGAYRANTGKYWVSTYADRFGTWRKAVAKAKIKKITPDRYRQIYTEDLKRVAREFNNTKILTVGQYEEKGKYQYWRLLERFGSWKTALKSAGLKTIQVQYLKTPKSEFIKDIKKVAKQLKKNTLVQAEYDKHGKYRARAIRELFNGWFKALKKAGLKPHRLENVKRKS